MVKRNAHKAGNGARWRCRSEEGNAARSRCSPGSQVSVYCGFTHKNDFYLVAGLALTTVSLPLIALSNILENSCA